MVAAHTGEPVEDAPTPTSPSGIPLFIAEPREGVSPIVVTHNWCDRCTWYTDSERIEDEVLTDSGDGLTFNAAHPFWIDLNHGRLTAEDKIKASYLPTVAVDSVEKTERTPFETSGGDFVIDYEAGTVTFATSQSGSTVTASYSYANSSLFIISPTAGKTLEIEKSEVQFSKDIDIKDTIFFQLYVYNPADLPNKIPYGDPTVYKVILDYINEAEGFYPVIPAIGGSSGRGLTQEHVEMPFNYKVKKPLAASVGAEIRIYLENDSVFGGAFATATFYCSVKDE